ncbi:MAG TPA: hypothetical protein VGL72_30215 [Bryobacteraceae bacterium]
MSTLLRKPAPLAVIILVAILSISLASCSPSAAGPTLLARPTRPAEPDARTSRTTGAVTAVEDGNVIIDLGSLDGLTQGSEVEIVRASHPVGRLTLTTIARDGARGPLPPKLAVEPKDGVRVSEQAVLRTTLDQIDALISRGNTGAARRLAEQAHTEITDPASLTFADWNNLGVIAELHGHPTNARMLYTRALRENPPQAARQAIESNLTRVAN